MQEQATQKLEELSSPCIWDKSRLKEAQTHLQNISVIDSSNTLFWTFFVAAVVRETNESEELAQLGNDFAKSLIAKGLSIHSNQPNSSEGTVLHISAGSGNLPMTKFLVEEKKADLYAENDNEDKETPLDRAKKELADEDTTDPKTIEGLKQVIAYIEQKQSELSRKPRIAGDSPIFAQQRTTPPPGTPSPTDGSPTPGSPEDGKARAHNK